MSTTQADYICSDVFSVIFRAAESILILHHIPSRSKKIKCKLVSQYSGIDESLSFTVE